MKRAAALTAQTVSLFLAGAAIAAAYLIAAAGASPQ